MKLLKTGLLACLFLVMISCGKGIDCDDPNLSDNWADDIEAIEETNRTWFNDQTVSNCKAYKKAINNYIDELNRYKHCAGSASGEKQFEDNIQEFRDVIASLDC